MNKVVISEKYADTMYVCSPQGWTISLLYITDIAYIAMTETSK